jgi:hypothetical protein
MNVRSMNPNLSLFLVPIKLDWILLAFYLTRIKQEKNINYNLNKSDHDIVVKLSSLLLLRQ